MSHNIDMTNDRANIAFLGSREDVWHKLGQEMKSGMAIADWAKAAGLDWEAKKVPAVVNLHGPDFDHIEPGKRFLAHPTKRFIVRGDTGHALGIVSKDYKIHQPAEVLAWFEQYIGVDPRFQLDVAGSLEGGRTIWATATFKDALEVAGDRHVARVLMSTSFDGSSATINQGTMTRTVCRNTLNVSLSDKRAMIRTAHTTDFNAAQVGKELAQIAQGFASYKAMGDAMAMVHMTKDQVSDFFKTCLEIPLDAKKDDLSTRKQNQFQAVVDAYKTTATETEVGTAWAALNAITRYVDHEKTTDETKRFHSANFKGSGLQMKALAVDLLMPRIKDRVAIPA